MDVRLSSSDVGVAIVGLAPLHRSGVNAKLEELMPCREELSEAERWLNRAQIPPKSKRSAQTTTPMAPNTPSMPTAVRAISRIITKCLVG